MTRLVLFDIDGTLIRSSNSVGRDGMAAVVNNTFGSSVRSDAVKMSGKTDTSIMLELARAGGVEERAARRRMKHMQDALIDYNRQHIGESGIRRLRGVGRLLAELRREQYLVGLATGNLEPVAKMKMELAGLSGFFDVGGFGNVMTRKEVILSAVKDARRRFWAMERKDIFYVGDADLDVIGGREAGVNTIAVATGKFTAEQLSKERPNHVLEDLSSTRTFMEIVRE